MTGTLSKGERRGLYFALRHRGVRASAAWWWVVQCPTLVGMDRYMLDAAARGITLFGSR